MDTQRKGLRNIAIVLGLLIPAIVLFIVFTMRSKENSEDLTNYTNPEVPMNIKILNETPPLAELVEEESEPLTRYVVEEHTVVSGESFSLVTGKYWDDIFLWPDLYLLNDMKSEDPDLLYPDEIIDIYNRLGDGDIYAEREKELILEAYINVYDRYKSLGSEKDSAAWTLLWCATKYSRNFLELYSHRIDPYDLSIVQKYIEEEGFLD